MYILHGANIFCVLETVVIAVALQLKNGRHSGGERREVGTKLSSFFRRRCVRSPRDRTWNAAVMFASVHLSRVPTFAGGSVTKVVTADTKVSLFFWWVGRGGGGVQEPTSYLDAVLGFRTKAAIRAHVRQIQVKMTEKLERFTRLHDTGDIKFVPPQWQAWCQGNIAFILVL